MNVTRQHRRIRPDGNGIDDLCELGDDCNRNRFPTAASLILMKTVSSTIAIRTTMVMASPTCDPRWTGGDDCDLNGIDDNESTVMRMDH